MARHWLYRCSAVDLGPEGAALGDDGGRLCGLPADPVQVVGFGWAMLCAEHRRRFVLVRRAAS